MSNISKILASTAIQGVAQHENQAINTNLFFLGGNQRSIDCASAETTLQPPSRGLSLSLAYLHSKTDSEINNKLTRCPI